MGNHFVWRKKTEPIAVLSDGSILVCKGISLYLVNSSSENLVAKFNESFVGKLKGLTNLSRRLFRKNIRSSCVTSSGDVYFFKGRTLYRYDYDNKSLEVIYTLTEHQSIPLNMTNSYNEEKWQVVWGDYSSNPLREEVHIYALDKNNSVKTIYSFPKNTVRHIHNIIPDGKDGYFVLTGDNDKCAGIYHADADFSSMIPLKTGVQLARAVQGFPVDDGLLFATDSVVNQNYICLLKKDIDGSWIINKLSEINGSCIYGMKYKDGLIFSTTVESPEVENQNKILALLSRKRGSGILSDEVHLIRVAKDYSISVIAKFRKDGFPYKLFQYGVVTFPKGQDNSNQVVIYPVAIKKYDGCMGICNDLGEMFDAK